MKRFSIIGAFTALAIGLLQLVAPSPAQAMVTTCTAYVQAGTGWPSESGHLYNCMRTPHNSAEISMQTQIMNNVIAKTGSYGAANRTVMSNNHVDIRVFYNGTDALNTLQIQHAQGPQPTETGRSWATTAGQPHLTNPTTTIWIYTLNQWNALNGATPTSYDINQEDGTVHHELGHQVDQDWAQARTPPLTSSITNTPDPLWNAAIGYDAANISVADRNYAASQWPQLFVPGTTNWAPSEDFAEEVATEVGGGVIAAEDQWIQQHMTCSYWYAQTVEQNGGAEPAQLGAVACYGHTH